MSTSNETIVAGVVKPRLGVIRAVTVTAENLDQVELGYRQVFDYSTVARRSVTGAEAQSWGAPAAEGRELLIMRPASGFPTELRFLQWDKPADHIPFVTWGWNALELIVQDPDALAERISKSGQFTLTTPAHGVDTFPYLRACQAIGPAGEHLNLTLINPPKDDLPIAESFVDRCFIVTLGGPSIEGLANFYSGRFDNEASPVRHVTLKLMNRYFGLPADTKHPLAVVRLASRTKLEIDECPEGCGPRPNEPGGIPWGIVSVTLECTDIAPFKNEALGPILDADGQRSLTITGTAGERIELFEAAHLTP